MGAGNPSLGPYAWSEGPLPTEPYLQLQSRQLEGNITLTLWLLAAIIWLSKVP